MAQASKDPAAEPAETAAVDPAATPAADAAPEAPQASSTRRGKPVEERVSYRVLKRGDGNIFTGGIDPETGLPETYVKGDVVDDVPRSIAEALEERDFVEIQ